MKRRVFAAALIIALLCVFSGCQKKGGGTLIDPEIASLVSEVGKTLEDLRSQHPTYDYLHLDGYNFSAECFGTPSGPFAYIFFGTQSGPGIEDMASKYEKQLRCAGVYTTVEKAFPSVADTPVSVEDFLASVGQDVSKSENVDFWYGWVLFEYEGYSFAVNTKGGNADDTYAVPKVKIEKGLSMILLDKTVWSANDVLYDELYDELTKVKYETGTVEVPTEGAKVYEDGVISDADTAKAVADVIVTNPSAYGRVTVTEDPENRRWAVDYGPADEHTVGGCITVVLSRDTGEILAVVPGE